MLSGSCFVLGSMKSDMLVDFLLILLWLDKSMLTVMCCTHLGLYCNTPFDLPLFEGFPFRVFRFFSAVSGCCFFRGAYLAKVGRSLLYNIYRE